MSLTRASVVSFSRIVGLQLASFSIYAQASVPSLVDVMIWALALLHNRHTGRMFVRG